VRCQQAAIPDGLGFRTKPALARVMLERALEAEIPVGWVTADEVYGGDGRFVATGDADNDPEKRGCRTRRLARWDRWRLSHRGASTLWPSAAACTGPPSGA
jgi:hypothetical protein